MAEPNPRGPFRSGVRLNPGQVIDLRGRSTLRIGGRRSPKRSGLVGGTLIPMPRPLSIKPSPVASPVRRGIRNDHTPAGRARIQRVKSVRLREFSSPRKEMGPRLVRKPVIRGAPLLPPMGGILRGAISIGRSVLGHLGGSPVTGPTATARASQAAAGPIAGVRLSRPPALPRPRRGGSARAM